jgi:hypothetical protein
MSDPVSEYHKMIKAKELEGYKTLANSVNSLGNRGDPDAYDKVRFGQSINPPTIKLTREEIEERERARHLKEYLQTQAEYNSRQAAAAAAAGPKSPKGSKSPKGPNSPKGSDGSGIKRGGGRTRRRTSSGTYRRRPNRARSSRRSRARK